MRKNNPIEKNAKTVIIAHQGRQGSWDFINLERHAKSLESLLGTPVKFVDDIYGENAQDAIKNYKMAKCLFWIMYVNLMEKQIKKLQ